jgi:hypothetical protein
MGADPFLYMTKAHERALMEAKKRGPKALKRVAPALARQAILHADAKDQRREEELLDDTDRSAGLAQLMRPVKRRRERVPDEKR